MSDSLPEEPIEAPSRALEMLAKLREELPGFATRIIEIERELQQSAASQPKPAAPPKRRPFSTMTRYF